MADDHPKLSPLELERGGHGDHYMEPRPKPAGEGRMANVLAAALFTQAFNLMGIMIVRPLLLQSLPRLFLTLPFREIQHRAVLVWDCDVEREAPLEVESLPFGCDPRWAVGLGYVDFRIKELLDNLRVACNPGDPGGLGSSFGRASCVFLTCAEFRLRLSSSSSSSSSARSAQDLVPAETKSGLRNKCL